MFFIIEGNNGASYILNAKDTDAINQSLAFYKARTSKQKMMKLALKLYLNTLGLADKLFRISVLKSKEEVESYLKNNSDLDLDFALDNNCSLLISPTRDKIIVHHHGAYFHKFAFGQSYANVRNEANTYALLGTKFEHFKVSTFYDSVDRSGQWCSFKLGSQNTNTQKKIDITSALVELFTVSKQEPVPFSTYVTWLKKRYAENNVTCKTIEKVWSTLDAVEKNTLISLGLVHRDFKHWNINVDNGLLIYDFEEAVTDGLPLEDLFNYHIDPVIRYLSPSEVAEKIFENGQVKEYKRYLKKLDIDLDYKVLLYCYLMERTLFWKKADEEVTVEKYCALLEYVYEA